MTEDTLPILFNAEPRLFFDPISKTPWEGELPPTKLWETLCPQPILLTAPSEANLPDQQPSVALFADVNNDQIDDHFYGYQLAEDSQAFYLYLMDGRQKTPFFVSLFADPTPPTASQNLIRRFPHPPRALCVADANEDGFRDLIWEVREPSGKKEYHVYFNQMSAWQKNILPQKGLRTFRDDWIYLTRRLNYFQTKYHQRVQPELVAKRQGEEEIWELTLQAGDKKWVMSRFPDPTKKPYEPGMLLGGKDPETFLNDHLSAREWNLALRFGAFIPYTFRVLESTTPVGFMVGGEWVYFWKHLGLALEYDYGKAGVFPEELAEVDSGDTLSELPLRKDLPIKLTFHNVSSSLLFHASLSSPAFHTHLQAGVGGFYEYGQIQKKRFDISPALQVLVDPSQESYHALGPRGRVGTSLEKGAFHVGVDVLFDFGFPLNGEFESFDQYLVRGILSLTVGYHHL